MSKPSEVALARYIREVSRHGAALWVGAAVTIGTWAMEHLIQSGRLGKAEWWLHPTPFFYVVAVSLGLAVAQFMAWLALDKKARSLEGAEPEIGRGLKLIKAYAMSPLNPAELALCAELALTLREAAGRLRLRLRVSKPITRGRANVGEMVGRVDFERPTIAYFDFDGGKAPCGTLIKLFIWGPEQPVLQAVEIVPTPPSSKS